MKKMSLFALLTLFLSFSACAPSLGSGVRVSFIPPIETGDASPFGASFVRVRVDKFSDERTDLSVAEIDGRKVAPKGDVGLSVQEAIERGLRKKGAEFALFDVPVISGRVREWQVVVIPSFPVSSAQATATIEVMLTNEKGATVFSGLYSGETFAKHPFLSERGVEKVVGQAMSNAIKELLSDAQFEQKLRGLR